MSKKNSIFLLIILLLPLIGNAYPKFVEEDITILCAKYKGITTHTNTNYKLTCEDVRTGYKSVYDALQKPLFSEMADINTNLKSKNINVILGKDVKYCEIKENLYDCKIKDSDMFGFNLLFYVNEKKQVKFTVLKANINSPIIKKMMTGSRKNQENETSDFKTLAIETIVKASRKVDGDFIKSEFYNQELIIKFVNREVSN